ncbi:MAG TPA: antitoxin Xre/MbcA/ParS toxin-binding domain-containing protein [Dongiaceae bacterium]|jgi:hypothetical protein|nr:antitoxin Xre/MbcA/ParS toxin-binding domain-containing protein [Dongiaceae bacterium]
MDPRERIVPAEFSDAAIVTKAVVRAADLLRMSNRNLAAIIGVSEATVSRMKGGKFLLTEGDKPFELGVLLVRLYRSLDALFGGDGEGAAAWLRNPNTALDAVPLARIQTVAGLVDVIQYLDARRAVL